MCACPSVTEDNAGKIDHAFRATHSSHNLKKECPGDSVKGLDSIQEDGAARLVGSLEHMREEILEEDG